VTPATFDYQSPAVMLGAGM